MSSAIKAFVTKAAPAFKGMSYCPKSKAFKPVALEDYKNKYLLLFFYPLDFTFVCPTEIIQFSNYVKKFNDTNCEVLGCSIDSHYTHQAYVQRARAEGGLGEDLQVSLLSDLTKNIARDYGVLADNGISLRGTFIVDDKQVLRHASVNDFPVGRNVEEYLRLVQAFQHVDKHGEVCPASWTPGQATMKPSHEAEVTSKYWKNVHTKQ